MSSSKKSVKRKHDESSEGRKRDESSEGRKHQESSEETMTIQGTKPSKAKYRKKEIEEQYVRYTDAKHARARPDALMGSITPATVQMFVCAIPSVWRETSAPDEEKETKQNKKEDDRPESKADDKVPPTLSKNDAKESKKPTWSLPRLVHQTVTYVPGFRTMFEEILVNALDNYSRNEKRTERKMTSLIIDISREKRKISVRNNGEPIPVCFDISAVCDTVNDP